MSDAIEPTAAGATAGVTRALAQGGGGATAHRADEALDGPHGAGDHGEDHGHDDHGHSEAPLGPFDWGMWLTGAAGIALGLVVAWVMALSTGFTVGA
jgi:ABC-type Zn2+ transport system substrate-binding protein/surface adhesin